MADIHPLHFALTGGTELSVVHVCQLAGLLLYFRDDPALGNIIASLRDQKKYHPTTLELDIAWKFAGAGALVALEPATPHGVADFATTVAGRTYPVEVSSFPNDPFQSDLMAFDSAMHTALKAGVRRSAIANHIAIEVDIAARADGAPVNLRLLRSEMHAAVLETIRAFASANELVTNTYAFGTVAARLAQAHEQPDLKRWTQASCLTTIPRADIGLVGKTGYKAGRDTHWTYLRIPDDAFDPYDRLTRKLKIEARQLRGSNDGVIIIPANGLRAGLLSAADAKLISVVEQFRRNHRSTTALAFPLRPHKQDGTWGITGPFFSLAQSALPEDFWSNVMAVDRGRTILHELDALG